VDWGTEAGQYAQGQAAASGMDEATAIVRSRIDLTAFPPLSRAVVERIICASADLSYATDLVCTEPWLAAGVFALRAGAPVIADSAMVAAGITDCALICKASEPLTIRLARTAGITLAAAAVRLAVGEAGPGAVWVVGSESAAIREIISRDARPALVIGLPAGFVGAIAAKEALRASGVPALTNASEKGGPAIAVAACMALLSQAGAPAAAPAPSVRR
jgi:precorrin-8X/cobalt-precorrin-8 methylmutase